MAEKGPNYDRQTILEGSCNPRSNQQITAVLKPASTRNSVHVSLVSATPSPNPLHGAFLLDERVGVHLYLPLRHSLQTMTRRPPPACTIQTVSHFITLPGFTIRLQNAREASDHRYLCSRRLSRRHIATLRFWSNLCPGR
jgi:hypothetical protein